MSDEKIDVLAVMDEAAEEIRGFVIGHEGQIESSLAVEIDEARAAVAELIEADEALDALLEMPAQGEPVREFNAQVAAARARRGVALLRVTVP